MKTFSKHVVAVLLCFIIVLTSSIASFAEEERDSEEACLHTNMVAVDKGTTREPAGDCSLVQIPGTSNFGLCVKTNVTTLYSVCVSTLRLWICV